MEMIVGLIRLKSAPTQEGENIQTCSSLLKKVLPKVLGTLGLAAASGGISGAVHKAAAGNGVGKGGPEDQFTPSQTMT